MRVAVRWCSSLAGHLKLGASRRFTSIFYVGTL
jgi:hypothetical protein